MPLTSWGKGQTPDPGLEGRGLCLTDLSPVENRAVAFQGVFPKGLLVPEGVLRKRDEQIQGDNVRISNRRNPVSFASVASLQGAEVFWNMVPRVSATASRPPQPCAKVVHPLRGCGDRTA